MPDYMVRGISDEVWKRVEGRAARENWHVQSLVKQLLSDYGRYEITPSLPATGNPIRDQYRPLFGAAYDQLRQAPDWLALTDRERGGRLRAAMQEEDQKYNRPFRFPPDFDFVLVAQRLGLPDLGKIGFANHCPNGHVVALAFSPEELQAELDAGTLTLFCIMCGVSRPPTEAQRGTLAAAASRALKRRA